MEHGEHLYSSQMAEEQENEQKRCIPHTELNYDLISMHVM